MSPTGCDDADAQSCRSADWFDDTQYIYVQLTCQNCLLPIALSIPLRPRGATIPDEVMCRLSTRCASCLVHKSIVEVVTMQELVPATQPKPTNSLPAIECLAATPAIECLPATPRCFIWADEEVSEDESCTANPFTYIAHLLPKSLPMSSVVPESGMEILAEYGLDLRVKFVFLDKQKKSKGRLKEFVDLQTSVCQLGDLLQRRCGRRSFYTSEELNAEDFHDGNSRDPVGGIGLHAGSTVWIHKQCESGSVKG